MNREQILEIAKPILFNTEMVRAILDGRKSVTRRVAKGKILDLFIGIGFYDEMIKDVDNKFIDECRFKVGDYLYVRETFQIVPSEIDDFIAVVYKASENGHDWEVNTDDWKWLPSIHMPKQAARLFLKVTDVRIERLQDITPEQADKEGVGNLFEENIAYTDIDYGTSIDDVYGLAKEQFAWLWNSTIKKSDLDQYGWHANPYVWVISFERIITDEKM